MRTASALNAAFQSAPVIADGRTRYSGKYSPLRLQFQSAPVIADGRTRRPGAVTTAPGEVFQSAPVIADGRTLAALA